MSAGHYDFTIEQGAYFGRTFDWAAAGVPVNLTGYTAAMQLRETHASAVVVDWTPHLTIDGPAGRLTLAVPATATAALTLARGVYDLELTPPAGPAQTLRFLQGNWFLAPEVTRA